MYLLFPFFPKRKKKKITILNYFIGKYVQTTEYNRTTEPVICEISLSLLFRSSSHNKQLRRLTARYHIYVRILWVPYVFHSAITTRIDEERGARTYHYHGHSSGGWYWHHHYVRVHYRANVANPNRRVSPS